MQNSCVEIAFALNCILSRNTEEHVVSTLVIGECRICKTKFQMVLQLFSLQLNMKIL